MNRSELLSSLKQACDRQETTMTNLANQLYVAKNTLSSWFSEQSKEIPFNNLVRLARALDDELFRTDVVNYMFGTSNSIYRETEQNASSAFLRQHKEEAERMKLEPVIEELLSLDETIINEVHKEQATKVIKEFIEERDSESNLIIQIKNKFGIQEQDLRKAGMIVG